MKRRETETVIDGLAHDLRTPILNIKQQSKWAEQGLYAFERAVKRCPYRNEPGAACLGFCRDENSGTD